MYDFIIKNGLIVDEPGARPRRATSRSRETA